MVTTEGGDGIRNLPFDLGTAGEIGGLTFVCNNLKELLTLSDRGQMIREGW